MCSSTHAGRLGACALGPKVDRPWCKINSRQAVQSQIFNLAASKRNAALPRSANWHSQITALRQWRPHPRRVQAVSRFGITR